MSSFTQLLSSQFLQNSQSPIVVCHYTEVYPITLSRLLLARERKTKRIERIDLATCDVDEFLLSAQTTFLGQSFCYWIVSLEALSDKKKISFLKYIQQYAGPHELVVWSPTPIAGVPVIEIPESISKDNIAGLLSLMVHEQSNMLVTEAQRLLLSYKKLSVEQALQLLFYVVVAAADREQIFQEWGSALVHVDQSLFTLSQHLFAQNQKKFRELYDSMTAYFQDTFWISFWSDQLWRAIHVIDAYNAKDFATAKVHGARLPFSFMNTDWRKYNSQELIKLHNLLYTFDYQLKNGIEPQIDLFYLHFFK